MLSSGFHPEPLVSNRLPVQPETQADPRFLHGVIIQITCVIHTQVNTQLICRARDHSSPQACGFRIVLCSDPIRPFIDNRVVSIRSTPYIRCQVGLDGYACRFVVTLEAHAQASCVARLVIEFKRRNPVVLIVKIDALVNDLHLRLCYPIVVYGYGVACFDGQAQNLPFGITVHAALRAGGTVQARAHCHRINVTVLGADKRPVRADAVSLKAQSPCAAVLTSACETVDTSFQSIVCHEDADALVCAIAGLPGKQVVPDLIALKRCVHARADSA